MGKERESTSAISFLWRHEGGEKLKIYGNFIILKMLAFDNNVDTKFCLQINNAANSKSYNNPDTLLQIEASE